MPCGHVDTSQSISLHPTGQATVANLTISRLKHITMAKMPPWVATLTGFDAHNGISIEDAEARVYKSIVTSCDSAASII
jgi:hypothetical protein